MRSKALAIIVLLFLFAFIWMERNPDTVRNYSTVNAAKRQLGLVCRSLKRGKVGRATICTTPLPDVETFQNYYKQVQHQDEKWYAERGWKFYPIVDCSGEELVFVMVDKRFRCKGEEAELIDDAPVLEVPIVEPEN